MVQDSLRHSFVFSKLNLLSRRYTVNDRYSGDRFSGNDSFSGTKPPDNAIIFTVGGITVLVELFLENFGPFCQFSFHFLCKK